MKTSFSKSRAWLVGHVPYAAALLMVAFVIALMLVVKADIERTSLLLRQP